MAPARVWSSSPGAAAPPGLWTSPRRAWLTWLLWCLCMPSRPISSGRPTNSRPACPTRRRAPTVTRSSPRAWASRRSSSASPCPGASCLSSPPFTPPPPGYFPPEAWPALRVAFWQPKLWVNQYWGLRRMAATSDDEDALVTSAPLPEDVPVGALMCKLTGSQPCRREGGDDLVGDRCEAAKRAAAHALAEQTALARSLDSGAKLVYNTREYCALGSVLSQPGPTADGVEAALKAIL
mmetsp:Transcript_5156/g.15095  ORF Transcript_5156/g.15095 Transcript_5156/m.15095 type:complete len:237 (+) Transcript_5156:869-1579(+)